MARQGAGLPAVAEFNLAVVLDAIRRAPGGIGRAEIAASTALSPQTVLNTTKRLVDRGLVREAGRRVEGRGKPGVILKLRAQGAFVAGVHLDPTVITAVLLDLRGDIVAHASLPTPPSGDPTETVALTVAALDGLIEHAAVRRDLILGVGVATPGPVDPGTGSVVQPPLIPAWVGFRVRDAFASATGMEVLLVKDVAAAAVAERWRNVADPSANFAFVHYSTGVGLGLVLNDEVFTGTSGNAGDIGHVVVDPEGELCTCGRRGCFGETVRPYQLVRQAVRAGVLDPRGAALSASTVDMLFGQLVACADAGDDRAEAILLRSIDNMARYLTNVANFLDVDRIVLGGPYWPLLSSRYLVRLAPRMDATGMSSLIHPVDVRSTVVAEDVGAVGAGCLVLEGRLSPRASSIVEGSKDQD